MTSMCRKRLKYLRNGFTMLEMASEFDKRLWEMTYISGKWLKYMRNG